MSSLKSSIPPVSLDDAAIASSQSSFQSALSTFGEVGANFSFDDAWRDSPLVPSESSDNNKSNEMQSLSPINTHSAQVKQKFPVIRIPSSVSGISPKASGESKPQSNGEAAAAASSNNSDRASASHHQPYHYDRNNDSIAAVFDAVPFTPSQGVMVSPSPSVYPLHLSWSFLETPTGQDESQQSLLTMPGGSPPSGPSLLGSSPPQIPNPYLSDIRHYSPFGYPPDGVSYPPGIISPLLSPEMGSSPTYPVMYSTPFAQHHNLLGQMTHGPLAPSTIGLQEGQYDQYGLFHPHMLNYPPFLPASLSPQQSVNGYNSGSNSPPKAPRVKAQGQGYHPTRLSWTGNGNNSAPQSPPIHPPPPPPPQGSSQKTSGDNAPPSSPDPSPYFPPSPPPYGYYMQPQYSPYHSLMAGTPPSLTGSPMMLPPHPPHPPPPRNDSKVSKEKEKENSALASPHIPLVSVINTSPALVSADGRISSAQQLPHPPTHVPISAVPGYLTPQAVVHQYQRAPIHVGLSGGGLGLRSFPHLPPSAPSSGDSHRVHKSERGGSPYIDHKSMSHPTELKIDEHGLPKLNARQRRTLRRAKDRCILGIIDAGSPLLRMQGDMPKDHQGMNSVADGSEDGREGGEDRSDVYLAAALKVARGEMGAEAAVSAREILSKVSSDLKDSTLDHLMSGLSLLDKPTETIDKVLFSDLQVIRKISEAVDTGRTLFDSILP